MLNSELVSTDITGVGVRVAFYIQAYLTSASLLLVLLCISISECLIYCVHRRTLNVNPLNSLRFLPPRYRHQLILLEYDDHRICPFRFRSCP